VVIDTHPGAVPLTDAAWAAADVVVVPVGIGWPELRALEGLLAERATAFTLILAPNRIRSRAVIRPQLIALVNMARTYGMAVAPPIGDYPWLPRRARRSALVLTQNPGRAVEAAAADFRTLAHTVEQALAAETPERPAPAEVLEGTHG
jgi:cellulose biosynthesis protein BcsQ